MPDVSTTYKQKIRYAISITTFVVLLILFIFKTIIPILLIFAGILIALFFTGLSDHLQAWTHWKKWLTKTIVLLVTILVVIGAFWLIGASLQQQYTEFQEVIPKTIANAKTHLEDSSIGQHILESISSDDSKQKVEQFIGSFFKSSFGIIGNLYVVLFIALFFTISPHAYLNTTLKIVPEVHQDKALSIAEKLKTQLRHWITGKLCSMAIVAILTAIGLAIMGMKLWLVLAIIAGLLSFIPNFGPVLALIPAILVGLLDSPQTTILVIGLYLLVQLIESNMLTPLIQQQLIKFPPAVILIAQLFMGILIGGWGLLLATPITVVGTVLMNELYLQPRKKQQNKQHN
ncbi:AI-2E family transporter [Zhouia sp. PK063]|uniref:AI-2E family transporter n=1 Tax=Zhouia sp. PK063 TaxID=3373602 RepID=UPI0037AD3DA2